MVTTIGTSTWHIRVGDNKTPGLGTWEWYIKGRIEPETWDFTPIIDLEVADDNSIGTFVGQFRWSAVIRDVEIKTKAHMDSLKQMLRSCNDNNTLLYLTHKLGGVNEAFLSDDDWDATDQQIQVRILKIIWSEQRIDGRIGTVFIKRYTE